VYLQLWRGYPCTDTTLAISGTNLQRSDHVDLVGANIALPVSAARRTVDAKEGLRPDCIVFFDNMPMIFFEIKPPTAEINENKYVNDLLKLSSLIKDQLDLNIVNGNANLIAGIQVFGLCGSFHIICDYLSCKKLTAGMFTK
jgi:hypothetical protein